MDGHIRLVSGAQLRPKMPLDEFRKTCPGASLATIGAGARSETYTVGRVAIEGREFDVSATFDEGALLYLVLSDPTLAELGWGGMTAKAVAEGQKRNDDWLRAQIGATKERFPWGHVISNLDVKNGTPQVVVAYYQPANW